MNKMNVKNKKVGCHCEENFSSTKQSSTPVSNQCFDNIGTTGCNLEDCRVGVSHLLAMTRIGRSLEKIFKKIFRDDAFFSTPAALIPILAFAAVLSTGIISESWAGCEGCEGECIFKGCDYECTACKEGYELSSTCWFKTCTPKCPDGQERISGTCTRKCTANEDRYNGVCVDKCATDELRATTGTCVKSPACSGGSACRDSGGLYVENCCYKIEGDTTTLYPNDSTQTYSALNVNLPDNKNLIISEGAVKFGGSLLNKFDTAYICENSSVNEAWCAMNLPNIKHIVIPDSGVSGLTTTCGSYTGDFICLGDIEICKENIGSNLVNRVVAPSESQCNGSRSYYYTGNSCEKRPEDPDDMVCRGGYAKLDNNCVDPLKTFAKKRYTPAEAAQWLKDEDNEITITFKK